MDGGAAGTALTGPGTSNALHLLPPTDPQGLVSFYVTLASSILGFVTMFQLRANAPGLKFRDWLAAIAALLISARRPGRGPAQ